MDDFEFCHQKIYSCQWIRQVHKALLFHILHMWNIHSNKKQWIKRERERERERKRMEVGAMFQPKEDELSIFQVHLPVTGGVTCKTYDRQCRGRERAKYFKK